MLGRRARARRTVHGAAAAALAGVLTVGLLAGPSTASTAPQTAPLAARDQAPTSSLTATRDVDPAPCDRYLRADALYRANNAEYRTDDLGRPEYAEATDLTVSPADRGPCQGKVGRMAPVTGYDGGHLVAATLHGVDRRYDLVPQWYSINRGIYLRWEEGAKRCLQAPGGRVLRYAVQVDYPTGDTVVPERFVTRMTVSTTGHERQSFGLDIPNRAVTDQEYQRLREQLNTGLENAGCTA
ncbi:DNA/RNA non-specific endonuclease [Actinomadura miaoliensis]|uniref:Type VII secretion system protein EssD-like domain-containing protein n=1 Tax=Actinomadura miaoliensis TaxID=430685 RepID=A0ABP7W748_9ACTN